MVNVQAASPRITQRQQTSSGWFEPTLTYAVGSTSTAAIGPTLNRMRLSDGFINYRSRLTVSSSLPSDVLTIKFVAGMKFADDQLCGEVVHVAGDGTLTPVRLRARYVPNGVGSALISVAALPALSTASVLHVSANWLI